MTVALICKIILFIGGKPFSGKVSPRNFQLGV